MAPKLDKALPALLITLLLCAFLTPQSALARSVTVCASGCDYMTIQAAIDAPDVLVGDTIVVNDPIHTEAAIEVHKDVTIQGQGAETTIVQAHAQPLTIEERVFWISRGATVTLRDMTIRHGNPTSEPESGGGIRNEGTLTLENVIVRDNSGSAGGGILNDGTMTVMNSTITHNEARGGGDHYLECSTGGGLKVQEGEVTLINTTISDNHAEGKGGGVHVACKGTLELVNSTVSANISAANGGGVYLNGIGQFAHSTIAGNRGRNGGGLFVEGTGEDGLIRGQLNFTATLIADNEATLEKYGVPDCYLGEHSSIAANTYNLIGDGTCEAAFSGDAMLSPLSEAESSVESGEESAPARKTRALALLPESPAVDAVPAEECWVTDDQWGAARPQGQGCDIGALELPQDDAGIRVQTLILPLLAGLSVVGIGVIGWLVVRRR